jgi:hypothetical protein
MSEKGASAQIVDQTLERVLRDQAQRQERLRHAQVFLASPLFVDLSAAPLTVGDDPEALREHHRDLSYRIGVLESVLALMTEERAILERVIAAAGDAGEDPGEAGPAADQDPDQA